MHPWVGEDLVDDEAAAWFAARRKGGGQILDDHLLAIRKLVGDDVTVRLVAPVAGAGDEPRHLFVEIDLPVDDEEAHARLREVQAGLLAHSEVLRERTGNWHPLQSISVVLTGRPRNWDEILKEIEDLSGNAGDATANAEGGEPE